MVQQSKGLDVSKYIKNIYGSFLFKGQKIAYDFYKEVRMLKKTQAPYSLNADMKKDLQDFQETIKEKICQLKSYGKQGALSIGMMKLKSGYDSEHVRLLKDMYTQEYISYKGFTSSEAYAAWRKVTVEKIIACDKELRTRYLMRSAGHGLMFIVVMVIAFIINASEAINLEAMLGIKAPAKLIGLGITGALVHYAMKGLEHDSPDNRTGYSDVVTLRLFIAIVFPIVVVMLLFDNVGGKMSFSFTPEISAFLIGYSSTLVSKLLSKLVDLGEKIIDLLN